KRRAQAAVTLCHLGRTDHLWPLLRESAESADPTERTYLIHLLGPLGTDSQLVVSRLLKETDVYVRRAPIVCLGEVPLSALAPQARQALVRELLQFYGTDPDAGVHSAVRWLLHRWDPEAANLM